MNENNDKVFLPSPEYNETGKENVLAEQSSRRSICHNKILIIVGPNQYVCQCGTIFDAKNKRVSICCQDCSRFKTKYCICLVEAAAFDDICKYFKLNLKSEFNKNNKMNVR